MNTRSRTGRRRTTAGLISLVILAAGLFVMANPSGRHHTDSPAQDSPGSPEARAERELERDTRKAERKAQKALIKAERLCTRTGDCEGALEAITTAPEVVCAGRTFLARVTLAEDADISELYLGGIPDEQAVLRAYEEGTLELTATAYNADGQVETLSHEVQVIACDDLPRITLQHRVAAADVDEVIIAGSVLQGLEEPITWSWNFGDGVEVETGETPRARHSYRLRPQTGAHSHFAVTVTATDAKGVSVSDYLDVQLSNGEWALAKNHGILNLPTAHQRFPEINDLDIEATFDLRHIDPDHGFTVDKVVVEEHSCDATDKLLSRTFPAGEVLDMEPVAPGALGKGTLKIPYAKDFTPCRWRIELLGSLDDGRRASALVSLENGAPAWITGKELTREQVKRAFEERILRRSGRALRQDALLPVVTP